MFQYFAAFFSSFLTLTEVPQAKQAGQKTVLGEKATEPGSKAEKGTIWPLETRFGFTRRL